MFDAIKGSKFEVIFHFKPPNSPILTKFAPKFDKNLEFSNQNVRFYISSGPKFSKFTFKFYFQIKFADFALILKIIFTNGLKVRNYCNLK